MADAGGFKMSLALSNGGTFLLMVSKNTGGLGVEMGHFVMARWVCALRVLLGGWEIPGIGLWSSRRYSLCIKKNELYLHDVDTAFGGVICPKR